MQNTELTKEFVTKKFPEFEAWKEKYGNLTAIAVEDKIALFKKPSRDILKMAAAKGTNDPIGYLELLGDNCFVGGDRELLDDDDYFMAIMPLLNDLAETKTAELLKL